MQAFGRPLFAVHAVPLRPGTASCADVVRGGLHTGGFLLLQGARMLLRRKAPRAHAALESFRRLRGGAR